MLYLTTIQLPPHADAQALLTKSGSLSIAICNEILKSRTASGNQTVLQPEGWEKAEHYPVSSRAFALCKDC